MNSEVWNVSPSFDRYGDVATRAPAPAPAPPPIWSPSIPPFNAGSVGSFDLSITLPAGIARGGVFGVNAGSLPAGVTLSAGGVLTSNSAVPAMATGIIFSYDTP